MRKKIKILAKGWQRYKAEIFVKKILWLNALTQKLRINNEMVLCNMSMEYNKVLKDITERTTISLCQTQDDIFGYFIPMVFVFVFLYLLFIENSEFSNKKNIIFGCNGLSTSCPGPSVTLKRGKSELFAIDKSLKTWKTASYRKVQISPRSQNTMENFISFDISRSVLHN